MRLDFYYYSYQCPLNVSMIQMINEYSDKIEVHIYDISNDSSLAKSMRIFYPALIVLNQSKRYYSPLRRSFLDQVVQGIYPDEKPYLPELSDIVIEYMIEPLTLDNIDLACECCGGKTEDNCFKKRSFLQMFNQKIYGFIHKDDKGKLLGGVEYLPSELVPYDICHDQEVAFITCVYLSDIEYDYKSAPLKKLEEYLKNKYSKVCVITDEKGVFPNGDLKFFIRNGYMDEGIIYSDDNYCKLHLVSKVLSE